MAIAPGITTEYGAGAATKRNLMAAREIAAQARRDLEEQRTEAAALADQLEQAGNDWGAGVVRRLAGITLVETQPSANPGR